MPITRTNNLQLQKPATTDRLWDVPLNANADALDALAPIGMLAVTLTEYPSTTLHLIVSAGSFINAALVYKTYAGGGVTVTASVTTHVWLTDAGAIGQGASWPTAGTNHVRIATVVAGVASITSIVDERTAYRSVSS